MTNIMQRVSVEYSLSPDLTYNLCNRSFDVQQFDPAEAGQFFSPLSKLFRFRVERYRQCLSPRTCSN